MASLLEKSDQVLIRSTARVLTVPRAAPADSFVLHSALELLARVALMEIAPAESRSVARARLGELAAGFEAFGDPVDAPVEISPASIESGAARLIAAISSGELDDVDSCAAWLGRHATPGELRDLLADALVPSLGAAGHAAIFLHLLPRVAARGTVTGELLRGLARALGRDGDWRLHWISDRREADRSHAGQMLDALGAVPKLERPPSTFIFPLMSRVDVADKAPAWLGSLCGPGPMVERGREVQRAAAWSMVNEPSELAPYGWTHALTMSQATIGVADACVEPTDALAAAATYVAGFRTMATTGIDTDYRPTDPGCTFAEAIAAGVSVASAAAWTRCESDWPSVRDGLASHAVQHHDAHLVKFTVACIESAEADVSHRRLFAAAAASLAGWWATQSA